MHKNTTHAIVSSDFDAPFYAEALGLPEDRLVPTGIPRMDRFFDPVARDAALARARELLPQIAGHQVCCAATYRGEKVATASYDFDQLDLDGLYALAAEKDAVVLFKHHPFITHRIDVPDAYRDRYDRGNRRPHPTSTTCCSSVDLLITDYSSIVFEFSVLNRPMVFFAYDLDEYIAERDFYVPFDEFVPGPIVRHVPRAPRRHPAGRPAAGQGRGVRRPGTSPISTASRRTA